MDRFDESAAHGVRGLAVARATGQGFLVPMLTQASATAISIQGRLVEAAELLDGAVEASRLAGNDQTLAWDLLNRAFVDVHRGEMGAAIADAEESMRADPRTRQRLRLDARRRDARHRAHGERRARTKAVELFVAAGGGEALPLLPGGWRAKYLELLTRWLADARQARRSRARGGATPRRSPTETGLGMASAWAQRAAAATALDARRRGQRPQSSRSRSAAACDLAGAVVEAAVSRTARRRALAQSGEGERAVAELQRAIEALEESGATRYRLEAERELRKLGHAVHRRSRPGKADETGIASLTRARARARAPRGRPQDEPRDRRRAVPQPEDRRIAPAEHLPQARRQLTRRAGARRRARGSQARARRPCSAGVGRNLLRPHDVAGRSRLAVHVADHQERALDAGRGTPACRSSAPPAGARP